MISRLLLIFLAFFTSPYGYSVTLAGMVLPDKIDSLAGQSLLLNGAGVRKKFFFSIYACGLYLTEKTTDTAKLYSGNKPWRIAMHMVYKSLSKAKLVTAWNEGFTANTDTEKLKLLRERINQFNDLFEPVVAGDIMFLEYVPGKGTHVHIKGQLKGVIPGTDFAKALIEIWLGSHPVNASLKNRLLGK